MIPRLILIPLITAMAAANASAHGRRTRARVNPKPLPPLANPNDPKLGAKELFGRKVLPAAMPTRVIGFYAKGCIAGAEALPINGADLAGDAAVAQSLLGASRHGRAAEAARGQGAQGCRLARHPGRRHVAAARRADVHRTRQPSGRARCRHLADADAEPATVAQRARGHVGGDDGARRPARHRSAASGRRRISPSSAPPRRSRACSASSSTPRSRRRCAARPRATAAGSPRCGRCTATTITSTSASNARPAAGECESQPDPTEGEGCSTGDLAYWFSDAVLHPKPPEGAAKAEAADDDGGSCRRPAGGAERAGCEAIASYRWGFPRCRRNALTCGIAAP